MASIRLVPSPRMAEAATALYAEPAHQAAVHLAERLVGTVSPEESDDGRTLDSPLAAEVTDVTFGGQLRDRVGQERAGA